jgi:hypothetical protein
MVAFERVDSIILPIQDNLQLLECWDNEKTPVRII